MVEYIPYVSISDSLLSHSMYSLLSWVTCRHWWNWWVCSAQCKSRVLHQSTINAFVYFVGRSLVMSNNHWWKLWSVDTVAFVRIIVLKTDVKTVILRKKKQNLKFSLRFLLKGIGFLYSLLFHASPEMLNIIFTERRPFVTRFLKSLTFGKEWGSSGKWWKWPQMSISKRFYLNGL